MPPFHIIGPGRCGSVLLAHMLNTHEKVSLDFPAASDWLFYQGGRALGLENKSDIAQSTYQHKETAPYKGLQLADRWAVTSNPRALAVLLVRDPRDVLSSWHSHIDDWDESDREVQLYKRDLLKVSVAAWVNFWNLMCAPPDSPRIHVVKYEDLIDNPSKVLRGCATHLGLDYHWAHKIHDYVDFDDLFMKHGTTTCPEASVDQWRELHPGWVLDKDQSIFHQVAGEVMKHYGYD